jgi:hypothetical protein
MDKFSTNLLNFRDTSDNEFYYAKDESEIKELLSKYSTDVDIYFNDEPYETNYPDALSRIIIPGWISIYLDPSMGDYNDTLYIYDDTYIHNKLIEIEGLTKRIGNL